MSCLAPKRKVFRPLLIGLALACALASVLPSTSTAQKDKCHPGRDCPEDLPQVGKEVPDVTRILLSILNGTATAIYGASASISELDIEIVNGDVASGVVLKRDKGSIAIDLTPCILNKKKVKVFRAPFHENNISDVRCGSQSYPRVQVIQESPI
jgi:hypothetical protein